MNWAERLASGEPIAEPVAVVVAHADDETLWAGSALGRFRDCRLIHLTDSAPRDGGDAARLGIATREAYAALRAAELDEALQRLGATPVRIGYAIADKELVDHLPDLVDRLARDCAGAAAIVAHPYEGGHPDHDSAAFAVSRAAARMVDPPALVEFASYHEVGGTRVFGRFWTDPEHPEQVRPLPPDERSRVADALAAHASQADVFGEYRPDAERWRAAPRYDFAASPPPGRALYDGFGWDVTSASWRERAAACR